MTARRLSSVSLIAALALAGAMAPVAPPVGHAAVAPLRLLYERVWSGTDRAYVADPGGGVIGQLSFGAGPACGAQIQRYWPSPDERHLLFYGQDSVCVARADPHRELASSSRARELVVVAEHGSRPTAEALASQAGLVAVVGDLRSSLVATVHTVDVRTRSRSNLSDLAGVRDLALSPDRRSLAFVGSSDGYDAIYRARTDGTGVLRLTAKLTTTGFFGGTCVGSEANPTWSPDGSRIAFQLTFSSTCNAPMPTPPSVRRPAAVRYTSSQPNTLVTVNADGSALHILGIDGYLPRWSPDGTHIAFVERATTSLSAMPGTSSAVVSLAGGGVHSLGLGTTVEWSPDSDALTVAGGSPSHSVGVYSADGRLIRRVAGRNGGWTRCGLVISRSGTVAVSADGRRAAVAVDNGIVLRRCGAAPQLLGHGRFQPVALAPNNSRLLVRTCRAKRCRLAILATGKLSSLGVGVEPAWSPDGKRIAFLVGDSVAVANTATGLTRNVAVPGADQLISPPRWTNNTTLLYQNVARAPETNLYTLDAGDGAIRLLARNVADLAAWSPDGRTIAYSARDGLRVADIATGRSRRLIAWNATLPTWSPDGSKLAFVTDTSIFTLGGSAVSGRLFVSPQLTGLSWSPDGTWLAFTSSALWLMHPDGTDAHPVAANAFNVEPYEPAFTWSQDGQLLYYQTGDGTWALPVDGGTARRLLPRPTRIVSSPDGLRIAYLVQQQLWVADTSGLNAQPIAPGPFDFEGLLSWSRAGILAVRSARLTLVEPNGSGETTLTAPGTQVHWAAWQPSRASRVALEANRG